MTKAIISTLVESLLVAIRIFEEMGEEGVPFDKGMEFFQEVNPEVVEVFSPLLREAHQRGEGRA